MIKCIEESVKDKRESLSFEELIRWRRISEKEMENLNKQLSKLQKTLVIINKDIWNKCDHKWNKVEGATMGDLCSKCCENCNLYNVRSLYTN